MFKAPSMSLLTASLLLALTMSFTLSAAAQNAGDQAAPVWVPTAGFKAPQTGEYPRLLFRKADIPALRAKAQTPQGKQMIAHLKTLLGGGDAMPERFGTDAPVNNANEGNIRKHPVGTYTLSHSTGFGLLYVLTGEKRYADLARECLDKLFEGQVDRDSRCNWTTPGTGFRLSFVLQSICLTYDLCADAWPADYRKSVVEKVMNMKQKKVDKDKYYTLEDLANGGGYPPSSNHFGAFLLGPGLVAMTFKGEPGADDKRLDALLETVEKNLNRVLGQGFGDGGWFAEGTSCGRISANNGVVPLIQSLKIAAGKDYISPRPHARYTALRLMHEIVPTGKSQNEKAGKYFDVPSRPMLPHRGDYGDDNLYSRVIISHMGDFANAMGSATPDEARAMAWIYDQFIEPEGDKTFNAEFYPHLAVYAFVNWPAETKDPDDVLPHVIADNIHGYYVARNRWQDKDDILVTTLFKRGPSGYKSGKVSAGTMVWGPGVKARFGRLGGATTHFRAGQDGSMELADDKGNALAVDYSGAAGVTAVILATDSQKLNAGARGKLTELAAGDKTISVLTFSEGEHPTPTVSGDVITIGSQTVRYSDGKLTFSKFTPAK